MCGITGWIDWKVPVGDNQLEIIKSMGETLAHRGPDQSGIWYSGPVALAHQRLAVIDPDGGKQPMCSRQGDGLYVIVYNGELYNTNELKKKLTGKGYSFQGHCDTEVVLKSYVEWGETCLEKFNGIFALAIWDQSRKSLFMARDRLGVKPLFYYQQGRLLVFGSELKALLAHPRVLPEVDREGLAEVLVMGPGRTPGQGIFRGVRELKPGYYLIYSRDQLKLKKYWSLVSKPHCLDPEQTVIYLRQLFKDTVCRQLIADVPLCTMLSGGLDSSAITAVASDYLHQPDKSVLHSFSIEYQGNRENFTASSYQPELDRDWVKIMSETAGTVHHRLSLDSKALYHSLEKGMLARDLPGMADIDISLYLFCREISRKFKVAISGECADEIFGGYPWFYSRNTQPEGIFPWTRVTGERFKLLTPELREILKPEQYMCQRYRQALLEVPAFEGDNEQERKIRELTYLNLFYWMPVLLERKDRMSMYTGLEIRVPFCDHRLVEFLWNVPWNLKNYQGRRKGLLREAMLGILPEQIRLRPKNPYPRTHDPLYLELTRQGLTQIASDREEPLQQLIDIRKLKQLLKKPGDYGQPWFGQLMRLPQLFAYLIQLNLWLDKYNIKIKI